MPRAFRAQQPMPTGGDGGRSWWALVRRDSYFHPISGFVARAGGAILETPVVVIALLYGRQGVCVLLGGPSSARWRRRGPPFGLRSGGRAATCRARVKLKGRCCVGICVDDSVLPMDSCPFQKKKSKREASNQKQKQTTFVQMKKESRGNQKHTNRNKWEK